MVRAPRWASMRLKRPSPAPISRTILIANVAALLQHYRVEEQGSAGVAFVDEADVFGGEGLSIRWGRLAAGIRIWFSEKGAAIMHE